MTHTWTVTVELFSTEDGGDVNRGIDDRDAEDRLSTAHARLTMADGTTLEGFGRARRNPIDREVPEIGEELAAARALRDLADRLLNATSDDLSAVEHTRIHLAG
ncbi:DUF1876 domain-containing protein [Citricoccus sp. SGAir0253]|uniref:dsRBD fold-containing protein n=1 Tax=Citricoccus sp. SGAir0253 TaxID=2567881 RepID=UPI0010CCC278|nr:dsRBD fold-containing protein [Citricoccus sp. SGAir0253]QCU78153.1 DUF1876 domain-containing protein [Citricoccus sp. SGAir0253]